jgi:hypothetical protein
VCRQAGTVHAVGWRTLQHNRDHSQSQQFLAVIDPHVRNSLADPGSLSRIRICDI